MYFKKPHFSISSKMVLTNVILILIIVTLLGYISIIKTNKIYRQNMDSHVNARHKYLWEKGRSEGYKLALNSLLALSKNDYTFLQSLFETIVERDNDLSYGMIIDTERKILTHNDPNLLNKFYDSPLKDLTSTSAKSQIFKREKGKEGFLEVNIPITSKSKRWGTVILGYSLLQLERDLNGLEIKRTGDMKISIIYTILIGLVFILAGSLVAIDQSLRLTIPVTKITEAVTQISSGDLSVRVNIKSKNELGKLGDDINKMTYEIQRLMEQTKEKAAMEKELEVARAVQDAIIPDEELHCLKNLEISGKYIPASKCGGDFWAFYSLDEDRTLVTIGDVTGHGTPTALITAAAKASSDLVQNSLLEIKKINKENLDVTAKDYFERLGSITYLLETLNMAIYNMSRNEFFMTFFVSVIDTKKMRISFASAAHDYPFIFQPSKSGKIDSLFVKGGARLGEFPDSKFKAAEMEISRDDVIVWYTDGIMDCMNISKNAYGESRFKNQIVKNHGLPAKEIRDNLLSGTMNFLGDEKRMDDITLVVARIL